MGPSTSSGTVSAITPVPPGPFSILYCVEFIFAAVSVGSCTSLALRVNRTTIQIPAIEYPDDVYVVDATISCTPSLPT